MSGASANEFLCRRYEAELAGLDAAGSAQAMQDELSRQKAYFSALNCDGSRYAAFEARPAQCETIAERVTLLAFG